LAEGTLAKASVNERPPSTAAKQREASNRVKDNGEVEAWAKALINGISLIVEASGALN
jgi:hypothetical protein